MQRTKPETAIDERASEQNGKYDDENDDDDDDVGGEGGDDDEGEGILTASLAPADICCRRRSEVSLKIEIGGEWTTDGARCV
jgi:hypothetical protein